MRNKAIDALIEMGIPTSVKGFRYIVDAMCLFAEDDSWLTGKMMALYWKIAQMNQTAPSNVERCIRHAFFIALSKGISENVKKYLTFQYKENRNLLTVFYIRLSQEELKNAG